MRRDKRRRTQLSPMQAATLNKAVKDALDPNGAPTRLAEIVEVARTRDVEIGKIWDFYNLVSDELQRLKINGDAHLVKGRGGGWVRGAAPT